MKFELDQIGGCDWVGRNQTGEKIASDGACGIPAAARAGRDLLEAAVNSSNRVERKGAPATRGSGRDWSLSLGKRPGDDRRDEIGM